MRGKGNRRRETSAGMNCAAFLTPFPFPLSPFPFLMSFFFAWTLDEKWKGRKGEGEGGKGKKEKFITPTTLPAPSFFSLASFPSTFLRANHGFSGRCHVNTLAQHPNSRSPPAREKYNTKKEEERERGKRRGDLLTHPPKLTLPSLFLPSPTVT